MIPNSDLAWESTGTSTSPIVLSGLDPNTYAAIEVMATLTKGSATPSLTSWTVSWSLANAQPTLLSPFDNEEFATTTPALTFFSTNPYGNKLRYQVQWSTSATFATGNVVRTSSSTSTAFTDIASSTAGDPFPSGDTIQYQLQSAEALASSTTYWWEVRAEDPAGSGKYSLWSAPQSFTVQTTVNQSTWYQTTSDQFINDDIMTRTGSVGGVVTATSTTGNIAVFRAATANEPITTTVHSSSPPAAAVAAG